MALRGWKLTWKGDELLERVTEEVVGPTLVEAGLMAEGFAKRKLRPSERVRSKTGRAIWVKGGGHGVRTGTLRRSIHLAEQGYSWRSDDVEPSSSTPERGGREVTPIRHGMTLSVSLGSGLQYALIVHQHHSDPEVFHFITDAVDQVKPKVPAIFKRHSLSGG